MFFPPMQQLLMARVHLKSAFGTLAMIFAGSALLNDPPSGSHLVFPYIDDKRVVEAVAYFAAHGIEKGQGVVLLVTPEHARDIRAMLKERGVDVKAVEKSAQLQIGDACLLADTVVEQGVERVGELIEPVLDRAKQFGEVRVHGEIVSILRSGHVQLARALEEVWNGLIDERKFTLLCTYAATRRELEEDLCNQHSHYLVRAVNSVLSISFAIMKSLRLH